MGIQVEFNPDLALRMFRTPGRMEEECLPRVIEPGRIYPFLKRGQRNYWFDGEVPLLITDGNQNLSSPIASVKIMNTTHFVNIDEVYTKGYYKVIEVYDPKSPKVHFNGINKIKRRK